MRRVTLAAGSLVLLGSLALNVTLLTRPRGPAPSARSPSTETLRPPAPDPANVPASEPESACRRELERCQSHGWEVVRQTLAQQATAHAVDPSPKARPALSEASLREQTDALCKKAKASLAESWRNDREKITAGLRQSLRDPAEQDRTATATAAEMGKVLHLDRGAQEALTRDYRAVRLKRIAAARDSLDKQPADADAAFAEARGLFADEDAIMARYGGDAGRLAGRSASAEVRTVILALLASLGNRDVDEALGW